ncbi:DNA-binding response OmpR family regulator [Bosea sp. OAE506]|jgi:DNA-binding response OmpR family regulator|uniref:response regulator n=1 Tax=Bosea sp. OAE506 TaxID=2663870 RepID=UPI00178AD6C5
MEKPLVLVVEDEPIILMEVEETLLEAGFDVVTAHHVPSAIKAFQARSTEVKALVTDIRMGTGADGWDLARKVREAAPAVPVIYMSGDSASQWSARGVPNSLMLSKPFAPAQLVTGLATLLNRLVDPTPD